MTRNIIKAIGIIVLASFIIPLVIFSCPLGRNSIPSDWLSFLGSYLGGVIAGIGTLLAIYFTIKYYEKQNDLKLKVLESKSILIKVDTILERIAARKTIEESLYYYTEIPLDLQDMINQYNKLQGMLISHFTNEGIAIFTTLYDITYDSDDEGSYNSFEDEIEYGYREYYRTPDHIIKNGMIVGQKALYENCIELLIGDPEIGRFINKEGGGSYGLWPYSLHKRTFEDGEYTLDELKEFFQLIPKITKGLELFKRNLNNPK